MPVFKNCCLFTGTSVLNDHAVWVENEKIKAVLPEKDLSENLQTVDCQGFYLAPGFIDLQIYGGGGSLFNSALTPETIRKTYLEQRRGGTTHFQITLSSVGLPEMLRAIDACRTYQEEGGKGLLGLHLEGPFFNPEKRGAHKLHYIIPPEKNTILDLIEKSRGIVSYMTLAPEMFSPELLDLWLKSEIHIAAGHSNATYRQAQAAFLQGISRVTHLFNAMSQFQSREPGLVGATYDSAARASIIADGIHCDFAALRISKKIMGERLFLITDAVTEDVSGEYKFRFAGDRFTDENGTLSGSALTMQKAVKNCVKHVGIDLAEALRMASTYPAEVAGKGSTLGKIQPGFQADMVLLNENLEVKGLVEAGKIDWF
jgi:N-acetylglucosamine-6-phosphate deacetylase